MSSIATVVAHITAQFGLVERPSWLQDADTALARMGAMRGRTPAEMCDEATRDIGLLRELAGHLAIEESYFFRDPEQIDALTKEIDARLRREAGHAQVLVLSAGCASGEEPYSLVMQLAQAGHVAARAPVIIGCDINADAVARARAGLFSAWSLRCVDAATRGRYFEQREDGTYRLEASVRSAVSFVHQGVAEQLAELASGCVDVLLFRNVAIHLSDGAVADILRAVSRVLRPDGLLVTAPTDRMRTPELFVPAPGLPPGTYIHRRGDTALEVAAHAARRRDDAARRRQRPAAPAPVATPDRHTGAAPVCGPSKLSDHLARGHVRLSTKRIGEAVEEFRRVVYLDRGHKIGRFWYAEALRRAGMSDKAVRQVAELAAQLEQLAPEALLEDGRTHAAELLRALMLMKTAARKAMR